MRSRFMHTAIAGCSIVALAGAAKGDIIHFANPAPGEPGHYDWRWVAGISWESWLDITRAPTDQPNTAHGNAILQCGDPFNMINMHQLGAFIAQDGDNMTLALSLGASFEGLTTFNESIHWVAGNGGEWTNFTPGIRQYIGVLTGADHYGWIEVSFAYGSLTAHSWAYETQPGVPITTGQIPAPGAAALLGFGLLGATIRRRP
ncbi:MAG: PEP-CTERM sorting domain-containing protein [Phycisphaeraceae bacterium]|nr:PEP-CTERM sorting domain-containing protein [Phycisphaeraceae bacterium]MBX3405244.1 PEP-CTERM sorting domain-containing protein [Phycisphaeraceae bacterium]